MENKKFYQRFQELRRREHEIRDRVPVVKILAQEAFYGIETSSLVEFRRRKSNTYQDLLLTYINYRKLRDSLPEGNNLRRLPEAMMKEINKELPEDVLAICARH